MHSWHKLCNVDAAKFFSVSDDQRPDLAIQELLNFFVGKSSDRKSFAGLGSLNQAFDCLRKKKLPRRKMNF